MTRAHRRLVSALAILSLAQLQVLRTFSLHGSTALCDLVLN